MRPVRFVPFVDKRKDRCRVAQKHPVAPLRARAGAPTPIRTVGNPAVLDHSEDGATRMRRGIRLTVAAAAAFAALATGLAVGQPVLAAGGPRVLMVDKEPDLTNCHF